MHHLSNTSPEIATILANSLKKREDYYKEHLMQKATQKPIIQAEQIVVKPSNINHVEFRRQLVSKGQSVFPPLISLIKPQAPPLISLIPNKILPARNIGIPSGNLVTVNLTCGLGNWIFKVLAGLGYAEKFGKQFVITRNNIQYGPKAHEQGLLDKVKRIFPNLSILDSIPQSSVITEKKHYNYSDLPSSNLNVSLTGYFQDERYFPSDSLIPRIKTAYYPNTYFVHIRAGDYLGSYKFDINLVQYYKNCFSLLGSDVKYIVFSNDTSYADTFMKQFGVTYTLCDKVDQVDTLIEMANCAGGICANSSFSWLGAFFQGDTRGQVFMPSTWIKGVDFSGIFPSWATVISNNNIGVVAPRFSKRLITIKLEGGLANRIFKILAGLGISEKYSSEFVICKSFIRDGNIPHEQNLLNHLIRVFPNIRVIDTFTNDHQYIETREHYTYNDFTLTDKNIVLHGAFQNEQYFPSRTCIPTLRKAYYTNTYFVHIRAGDYLTDDNFSFNLVNYYSKCFSLLDTTTNFIVFSNDNAYADTYMKQFNIKFSISDKTDPLDVLIEMSNCTGGICANSSLSWLGGYFQKEPRGKIFMPSVWMKSVDYNGVYPCWSTIIDINSGEIVKNINSYFFDIIIPVGPNDASIIKQQIVYTKNNIVGYRNIYLVVSDSSLSIEGCITISETIFPFSIQTIENIHGKSSRCGWYLQQLIKLYAGNIIPDILGKYLVIDSDTHFIKPVRFIENNKSLYAYGTEYHKPYFEHMKRLDPSFVKIDKDRSGICHHMLFETIYINEIMSIIESKHNDTFFNTFIKKVDSSEFSNSGASEYELYYNYMLQYHSNKIKLRELKWDNLRKLSNNGINDYESIHWHSRDYVEDLKICAVMWYDSNISSYADINLEINRAYCKKHNIELIVSSERLYPNRHAPWEKLLMVLKHIRKYNYIMWIDADAFFYIDAKDIRPIIQENINKAFIFSNDKGNTNINSGFFIVKNTEYSIKFLERWAYDEKLYIKNPFPSWWEQGVLIDMFKNNILDIQSNNKYYPYGILQHFSIDPLESFTNKPYILHVAGQNTEIRKSVSSNYYSKIKNIL
jgi:hypothetical protein